MKIIKKFFNLISVLSFLIWCDFCTILWLTEHDTIIIQKNINKEQQNRAARSARAKG